MEFLKDSLSTENAFTLLAQARLFNAPQLADLCLALIDRDTTEAIQADGFLSIDHETLCAVLRRDTLRVNELPLFNAALRWSSEECARKGLPLGPQSQREVLGEALRLIRFPQMGIEEFSANVGE